MPQRAHVRTGALIETHRSDWTTMVCDSLEKVFPDTDPRPLDTAIPQHVFRDERIAFQVAVLPPSLTGSTSVDDIGVEVTAPAGLRAEVSVVDLIPATFVAFDGHDEGYLRDTAGLYPDLVRPLRGATVPPYVGQWRSFWIDLTAADDAPAGPLTATVTLTAGGETIGSHEVEITVVDRSLPELDIVNTHWFHCDGLATQYGLEVWSEPHWEVIGRFMAAAAEVGINSILTPVWTPSLDTAVGHYRRTTQLVGIRRAADGTYEFDWSRLRRWMDLARANGIPRLEIAHLFTQWGALATPGIVVEEDGESRRRFGWDVPATDPAYRTLLEALIPQLRAVLDEHWGHDTVIWHISDEPEGHHAETYLAARGVVDDLLAGCTVVDALSDYQLYTSGIVPIPVAATNAAAPFIQAGVRPLWVYYCVGQHRDVANRFFGMPSSRNRALGLQLYRLDVDGFLHWGFNFYNSRGSLRPIDPFTQPDADGGFPAGDSFLVYPGADGEPWPSLRSKVFTEAMNDIRLCGLVEQHRGREAVLAIIDPDADLSLTCYSLDPDHYRRIRAALVAALQPE